MVNKNKLTSKIEINYSELKKHQRGSIGEPAYSRFINRWMGRVIASVLGCFNISPNSVTLFSFILSIAAFLCFILLHEVTIIYSAILTFTLIVSFTLDATDGQLARLLDRKTERGEWLDHMLDSIKLPFGNIVAVLFIINNTDIHPGWLILYIFALSLTSGRYLSVTLKTKIIDYKTDKAANDRNRSGIVKSILLLPMDTGVFMLLFFITYDPELFFIIYTAWCLIVVSYSIIALVRTWGELGRLR